MDKCREEFESSLGHTDGFHDGYVTWNEVGGMYMANDDEYECVADWMNGAFAIHKKMQAKVDELQNLYTQQGINILKLQKRVDKALEVIMEYYTGSYDESPDLVVDLDQALKGGNNGL